MKELEELLGKAGIDNKTPIVLYGDNNNWFAAWAFWQLKIYGHEDVRIMDGGRKKWLAEGRELTTDKPSFPAKTYNWIVQKPDRSRDDVVHGRHGPGYLRKNGVPYSANAVTEYFNIIDGPDGAKWLIVANFVDDPTYLTQPFATSTHFKKLPDGSVWKPEPCNAK